MSHPLQCRCGTLKGSVANPHSANRGICYCKDCQAYAHFLGRPGDILDRRGGSDAIQILPKYLTFTQGVETLACMRLTPKGMLRWYARCCNTPLGYTGATPKVALIGLLHNCLETAGPPLDDVFGPVRVWVNTKSAHGEPKPKTAGIGRALFWLFSTIVRARFNGDYKHTPLFRPDTGAPIVTAQVLSAEEHAKLMSAVRDATG